MGLFFAVGAFFTGGVNLGQAQSFRVCHGYGCYYQTRVLLTSDDLNRIAAAMAQGQQSAEAERAAVRRAVAIFEERSTAAIGIRDKPRMEFGRARIKGQMDCIDESTNTDHFLKFLQTKGWLKHHRVARRTSRGFFIDGRYPHWTAVLRDDHGVLWAVDSWFEPGGGLPDVMRLSEWKRRGVGGER
ncbi:hypothetical protein ATN84_07695 [Paramesorhizobium deserti]|uniref:Uncharacterized protein n=1 Tax=Paramesorhizobium deserti TaxID=1494590 RepID=A0A135HVP0_9HYPH|nr:hypothetical protein ATN84_07695 [Paramesorhizobium deserti]